jgi:two-component system invasion response regulator UvrY
LRRLVEGASDTEVVADAADGREAIRKTRETSPDVAVVDISMPGLDGLEVIRQIRLENPKLPVLVLTMPEEGQSVVRTIEAGAKGYLTERSAAEELLQAIRKVHGGGRSLSEPASEALATRMAKGAGSRSPLDPSSPGRSRCSGDWRWGKTTGRSLRAATSARKPSIPTAHGFSGSFPCGATRS